MKKTIGIILAGGRSTRMGRDKAALELEGLTLAERGLSLAREAGVDEAWVSGQIAGLPCVPDSVPGLGPLGGLHTAVERFRGERLLFVPVDMPGLSPDALGLLLARPAACAYQGYELPLVLDADRHTEAVLEELCVPEIEPRLRSVRELLSRLGAERVPVVAGRECEFANVNTPAEWEAFQR